MLMGMYCNCVGRICYQANIKIFFRELVDEHPAQEALPASYVACKQRCSLSSYHGIVQSGESFHSSAHRLPYRPQKNRTFAEISKACADP